MVNKDTGKPLFDCSPFHLDLLYLKDCGECEHTAKAEKSNAHNNSGYHASTGSWDASLYATNPLLLQSVHNPTAVWEAKSLDNLLEALLTLNGWFDIFSRKELKAIREEIRSGQEAVEKWTRNLNQRLQPVLSQFVLDGTGNEDEDDDE